ncbi:hypothetical protein ACEQPO_08920 [Bacillus sp. SL00103]
MTPQTLIEAVQKEKPDMIGLSGLLVKSASKWFLPLKIYKSEYFAPILVGGAALSRKFTKMKISPHYDGPVLYAKDAMDGLSLANELKANPLQFQIKPDEEPVAIVKERKQSDHKLSLNY